MSGIAIGLLILVLTTTTNAQVTACSSNPCLNNGTCTSVGTSYTCTCTGCFAGDQCQTGLNACSNHGCQNGGACNQVPGSCTAYTCTCGSCYAGTFCETLLNACSNHACQNGGACNQVPGSCTAYTCTCPTFYTGQFCEALSNWSRWYNCSHSCRHFRYKTCNKLEGDCFSSEITETRQSDDDCPSKVKTLTDFQNSIQLARSAYSHMCFTEPFSYTETNVDINFCYESYGSVQRSNAQELSIHQISPVTFKVPLYYDGHPFEPEFYPICTTSLVWDFVYEEWIENIDVQVTTTDTSTPPVSDDFLESQTTSTTTRSGNYFQASKFLTITHQVSTGYPSISLADIYFPPSAIKPEVALLDDSCAQAAISDTPICAYFNQSKISTIGCETVQIGANYTQGGLTCRCPSPADAYVILLEALPALRLPEAERVIAISGSGINMASVLVYLAQRIFTGMDISPEGADIFNNILSSILLVNGALLFDESIDYFVETSQQDILAQSLAYSLIALHVWMLVWIIDKSVTLQPDEDMDYRLGSYYQICGWTFPIIYVFVVSCFVEDYASYDYRHWPNIENNAIWTLFGPMTGLFLISFIVGAYKLHKISKMTAADDQETVQIRKIMASLIAYMVALWFLFGKWSLGIWTVSISFAQFIFSILLWVQFTAVIVIYCIYNYCCNPKGSGNGKNRNNYVGRDNAQFGMTPTA